MRDNAGDSQSWTATKICKQIEPFGGIDHGLHRMWTCHIADVLHASASWCNPEAQLRHTRCHSCCRGRVAGASAWSAQHQAVIVINITEGSLEVKLPTVWTDESQRWEESEDRREEKRSKKRTSQKKEDADARKGRKVAKHCVFPMIWGSGGSKSRLAKAAGAEPAGQMRDGKLHAVVARSTFPSQNVQNTPWSEHFWKLRRRKSARRCGAKHISKSKV